MNQNVTEAEALKFKADRDERLAKIREDMGQAPAQDEAAAAEAEEESPEVEAEEEPAQETETEVESTETEEEPQEESQAQQPFSSLTRELNTIRTQKRELEAQRESDKAAWEAEKARLVEENTTFKKNAPPPQPFVEYAKTKGINDPKDVKELYDVFKNQFDQDYGTKLSAIDEKIATFEKTEAERTEAAAYDNSMRHFDSEWSVIVPVIESEYKPTSEQMQQAYDLVAELAHTEKYHDKDLDYVVYKEAAQIEDILGGRKRRTFLPARGGAARESGDRQPVYGSEHERIMALRREQKSKINSNDGFERVKEDRI